MTSRLESLTATDHRSGIGQAKMECTRVQQNNERKTGKTKMWLHASSTRQKRRWSPPQFFTTLIPFFPFLFTYFLPFFLCPSPLSRLFLPLLSLFFFNCFNHTLLFPLFPPLLSFFSFYFCAAVPLSAAFFVGLSFELYSDVCVCMRACRFDGVCLVTARMMFNVVSEVLSACPRLLIAAVNMTNACWLKGLIVKLYHQVLASSTHIIMNNRQGIFNYQ